jgi:hypothetical protein
MFEGLRIHKVRAKVLQKRCLVPLKGRLFIQQLLHIYHSNCLLAFPRTGNDLLCFLYFLELPHASLLVPLVFIRMVFPHKRLKLFPQPRTFDILFPLLQVNGKL